jgi:hypothetical protein
LIQAVIDEPGGTFPSEDALDDVEQRDREQRELHVLPIELVLHQVLALGSAKGEALAQRGLDVRG